MTTDNKDKEGLKVMTPDFRVCFPAVFEPVSFNNSAPKYSLIMVFRKGEDLSRLKEAAKKAAENKWGSKFPKGLKSPFRDGADKEGTDGFEAGATFITVRSNQRPGLIDKDKNEIVDREEFYPGCYARATVRAFAYDRPESKGVSFGLNNVQKLRDGENLSGRMKAEADFEAVESEPFENAGAAGDPGDPFA